MQILLRLLLNGLRLLKIGRTAMDEGTRWLSSRHRELLDRLSGRSLPRLHVHYLEHSYLAIPNYLPCNGGGADDGLRLKSSLLGAFSVLVTP